LYKPSAEPDESRAEGDDASARMKPVRQYLPLLTRQPKPPARTLNQPGCYHFRVLDPRLPLCRPLAYLLLLGIAAVNARPDAA
jgi:hypothetical protein